MDQIMSLWYLKAIIFFLFAQNIAASPIKARDPASDASKVLILLRASSFCSSFITLHDVTSTKTTGTASVYTTTTSLPGLTETITLNLPGPTSIVTVSVAGPSSTTTVNLPASTVGITTSVPANAIYVTSTLAASSKMITTTLTVAFTKYVFGAAKKRKVNTPQPRRPIQATGPAIAARAPSIPPQLQLFASSVISKACALYVHPTTTTAAVAPPPTTTTITTQLPATTNALTSTLAATTLSTTTTGDAITLTQTTQAPALTTTITITLPATTITRTTEAPVVLTTTTAPAATTTVTLNNAPVCNPSTFVTTPASYGVYYSTKYQVSADSATACCQACFSASDACQEFVYNSGSGCYLYHAGLHGAAPNPDATCPNGIVTVDTTSPPDGKVGITKGAGPCGYYVNDPNAQG